MSKNLAKINLTNAIVGDTFTVSLQDVGIPQDFVNSRLPIYIRFFNDSCIGLDATSQKYGKQFYIPQGGWPTVQMRADETGINFVCTSQMLPVPSICFLQPVYYGPGEPLDDIGQHGNTPTNLGGSGVSTNVISNEGNPVNTLFIDGGPTGLPQMIQIFNDHFIWSVVQGGVAHQVLAGQIAGNPLLIGQLGDISEVLGNLSVDGGKIILNGNDILDASGANTSLIATTGNNIQLQIPLGTPRVLVDSNGLHMQSGKINLAPAGIGTIVSFTSGAGTGNGTSNTLITNPTAIVFDPCTVSGSTQTIGGTTTTTTTVTTGAGLAWRYIAYLQ